MEAFRKWWEKNCDELDVFCWECGGISEADAGIIWKEALEWFSSHLGYSEEHKALQDIIDKELEGK